jgi:hypothetical protein
MDDQQTFVFAASEYASEHINKYGFPENPAVHRCEIEIAFMQGAQWYNEKRRKQLQTELAQTKAELEALTNAN